MRFLTVVLVELSLMVCACKVMQMKKKSTPAVQRLLRFWCSLMMLLSDSFIMLYLMKMMTLVIQLILSYYVIIAVLMVVLSFTSFFLYK